MACHRFFNVALYAAVLFLGVKSISLNRFLLQNLVHMILRMEIVRLNFRSVYEEACFHSIDCCLDDGVTLEIKVSSPVTL